MRIMLLVPGTGHFYCGSCLRDDLLGKSLRALGHDVVVVPLYLPLVLEDADAEEKNAAVHMGGINMYLQQKSKLASRLPGWLMWLLDRPGLLRWASKRGNLTEAPDLGPMTVSMLMGEKGRQAREVEKLVEWTNAAGRPDVLLLSNVMLSGVVRRLREVLDCPIVSTLQGEAPFLDALPAPFDERAWRVLGEHTSEIDAFVAVSHYYGELMRERLDLPEDRVRVIHNGLDLSGYEQAPRPLADRKPRTIGYLARMCRDKGLHTLVDAFLELGREPDLADVRLEITGVVLREDRPLVADLQRKLVAAGMDDRVAFHPNVERAEKLAFLHRLSVLSVPATYGESFGLYLLEALAAGVPVVQPRTASFPEVVTLTEGGVLCAPDDASSLAEGLVKLLRDEAYAQELGTAGRRAVFDKFTSERMARRFEALCRDLVAAKSCTENVRGSAR